MSETQLHAVPVLLVKPETYMNNSGECIRSIVDFYKLDPARQLLVLVDDIDISLGELRFRDEGGPGTHNGLRSIVQCIGEKFPRLRIGLGSAPEGTDLATWVLSVPSPAERDMLSTAIQNVPNRVQAFALRTDGDVVT
jgi:PTH1 family peptidyl-tRNA hydrolase